MINGLEDRSTWNSEHLDAESINHSLIETFTLKGRERIIEFLPLRSPRKMGVDLCRNHNGPKFVLMGPNQTQIARPSAMEQEAPSGLAAGSRSAEIRLCNK